MKILIFGAGALGSLFGGFLASKNDVTLVGRAPHMDAIRKQGLQIEGVRKIHAQPNATTQVDPNDSPELVIIATKTYDTDEAIQAITPVVRSGTIVLTIQNGLVAYDALKKAFPGETVLAATVVAGVMLTAPGQVLYNGGGDVLVGGQINDLHSAGKIARLLREGGLQALGVPDIRGPMWQKAIVNAAINPLSALLNKRNGELLADPAAVARMKRVTEEGARVARALRVPLPERDTWAVVERIIEATLQNRTSMLEDVSKGRRTEIEGITGVIVSAGRTVGQATPENEALLAEVKALERAASRRAGPPPSSR